MFEIGLAVFTLASLLGGLAQTPELARRRPRRSRASARPWPHPACWPCSPPAPPTRRPATARWRCSARSPPAARRIGLLLGGVRHRPRLVALDPVHQRPDRAGRAGADAGASSTETPRRPGRFDVVGALTATVGAVSIVWALIGTPEHGWGSARTLGGFAVGALCSPCSRVTERRVSHPMIQPALLRSRRRVGGLAIDGLVVGGADVDVLPRRAVPRGRARLRPADHRPGVPAVELGIFAMSRVTPAAARPVRPDADVRGRHDRSRRPASPG